MAQPIQTSCAILILPVQALELRQYTFKTNNPLIQLIQLYSAPSLLLARPDTIVVFVGYTRKHIRSFFPVAFTLHDVPTAHQT